jgi:Protein of unknown function (DUF4011)
MGAVTSITAAHKHRRIDANDGHIERLLAETRLKPIQTGTRNRLIHTPRGSRRTRCLPIAGAKPDTLYVNLVREGKLLRFLAASGVEDAEPEAAAARPPRPAEKEAGPRPGHANRNGLQTSLSPDLLQKRLQSIHRDARTAEEERGVNILYLALGFLRWYEDEKSDALREAPLILLPVNLVRDAKRSTFDLTFRDDDINPNQALQALARQFWHQPSGPSRER